MKNRQTRSPFFERLKKGLEDALRHARGEIELKSYVIEIPDPPPVFDEQTVLALRSRLKLSQGNLALLLNVPIRTVRHWEAGKGKPSGAAARLLQIYSERPEIVDFIANGKNGVPAAPA